MLESDDDETDAKGEESESQKEKNKTALALITQDQISERIQDRKNALLKDKRAQQIALDVGANAVKNAIISGKTEEEALQIAQEAIERVLNEYRPSVSAEKGSEQAAKIIEEWVERENIKNNIFTCEIEINEYPTAARSKVMKKEYLTSTSELSKCTISLRGIFVEPGKKAPLGQKKLQLYIQGSSKQEVLHAYKEIKHFLDEEALSYYTTGSVHGYGGSLGKYHL
jgi:arylamine N-acetyltransferase